MSVSSDWFLPSNGLFLSELHAVVECAKKGMKSEYVGAEGAQSAESKMQQKEG